MIPASTSTAGTAGKILVIDDNPIIQRTMYFAFRDYGYTVLMSGTVAEALKVAREQRPDAILLDINFPLDPSSGGSSLRDGFWALDWLKHLEEMKHIPIIVISSDPPEKSQARALAAGAAGYFQKPIDKRALAATIGAFLPPKNPAPAQP